MPLDVNLTNGRGRIARMFDPKEVLEPDPVGVTVYSERRIDLQPNFLPALNPTVGFAMNINAAFSGTPEGIHDGTDAVLWTASAVTGIWDFASTAQAHSGTKSIDATLTNNNDAALFTDGGTISMTGFVALTGWIYVNKLTGSGAKGVELQARLNGVDQGNPIDLVNFADFGIVGAWQKFTIQISLMGLSDETINELEIVTLNAAGSFEYYLDDMQWEQLGGFNYTVFPAPGTWFRTQLVEFTFKDAIASLDMGKFMALSALTNGVQLTVQTRGSILFVPPFRAMEDFLLFPGSEINSREDDGTNIYLKIRSPNPEEIVLKSELGDFVNVFVADDLSGLDTLHMFITGGVEQREL